VHKRSDHGAAGQFFPVHNQGYVEEPLIITIVDDGHAQALFRTAEAPFILGFHVHEGGYMKIFSMAKKHFPEISNLIPFP
jgi:hypothetical protein